MGLCGKERESESSICPSDNSDATQVLTYPRVTTCSACCQRESLPTHQHTTFWKLGILQSFIRQTSEHVLLCSNPYTASSTSSTSRTVRWKSAWRQQAGGARATDSCSAVQCSAAQCSALHIASVLPLAPFTGVGQFHLRPLAPSPGSPRSLLPSQWWWLLHIGSGQGP